MGFLVILKNRREVAYWNPVLDSNTTSNMVSLRVEKLPVFSRRWTTRDFPGPSLSSLQETEWLLEEEPRCSSQWDTFYENSRVVYGDNSPKRQYSGMQLFLSFAHFRALRIGFSIWSICLINKEQNLEVWFWNACFFVPQIRVIWFENALMSTLSWVSSRSKLMPMAIGAFFSLINRCTPT